MIYVSWCSTKYSTLATKEYMCDDNYRIYVVPLSSTFYEEVQELLCGAKFSLELLNEGWFPQIIDSQVNNHKIVCYTLELFFILHASTDLHDVVDVTIDNITHSYCPEKLYFEEGAILKYTKELLATVTREVDEYNTK